MFYTDTDNDDTFADAHNDSPLDGTETVDQHGLEDGELTDELCTQAAHLAVAECHFVLLLAEFDRRELWGGGECRSCAHWLNWRCGISIGAAREQLRVGRALEHLPEVRKAFATGELSYSKVRAITRMATPELEEELMVLARAATASQLERLAKEYRRADPKEGVNAMERHRSRFLRSYTAEDGMVVIHARLSPEDGAVVLAAIEETRRAAEAELEVDAEPDDSETESGPVAPTGDLDAADVSAETSPASIVSAQVAYAPEERTVEMKAVDALVGLCESLLRRGVSADGDEPRVSVLLHMDESVARDSGSEGCSFIEGIGAVSSHTALRLACDAAVSRLVTTGTAESNLKAGPGRFRGGSAEPCSLATEDVDSRDARCGSSSTCIMSSSGAMEVRRSRAIWSRCAASIIVAYTKVATT